MAHKITTSAAVNTAGNAVESIVCTCGTGYSIPGIDSTSAQYAAMQAQCANHAVTGR